MKICFVFSALAAFGTFVLSGAVHVRPAFGAAPQSGVALFAGVMTIAVSLLRRPCLRKSGRVLSPYDK